MPGPRVAGGRADGQRRLAQPRTQLGVDGGGRRLLEDLLVPALQRAVAFAQVDAVAHGVDEQLHLDVAAALQPALQEDAVVAERGNGLAPGGGDRIADGGQVVHRAHPPAAAAGRGLDQQRGSQPRRLGCQRRVVQLDPGVAGDDRHARRLRQPAGLDLVPEQLHRARRRADPRHPGAQHLLGERRILREVAVAGVHRVRAGIRPGCGDGLAVEVGRDRDHVVGQLGVQRAILVRGDNGHRLDAELTARADHADGDLAAVRDQDPAELAHLGFRFSRNAVTPS